MSPDANRTAERFRFWFNAVMTVIYFCAGILFLFILHFETLPVFNTKVIGGVLLLYAAFRGYKLYKSGSVIAQNHPRS